MRRFSYYFFIFGFLISSCTQTETIPQSAIAIQVLNENGSSWLTFPAPLPNDIGETFEIQSSDYPISSRNFILDDTRTNIEKLDLIESWAPENYQKEVNLYAEEWERMGRSLDDLEILASIVDGKSWVLVPKDRKTGQVYVPKAEGLIQTSLHLFGCLDRGDDFFDLVPVAIDGAEVVGDASGYHVVASVEDGRVARWYDAVHDRVMAVATPEPSQTPDTGFAELLPPTLEECRENNIIHYSTIQEDLKKIKQKIEETGPNPNNVAEFSVLIPSGDPKEEKTPSYVTLNITNPGGGTADACASLELESGKILTVYVIPIKRMGSDIVGHLFFAKDTDATRSLAIQRTGGYDYDEEEAYVHLKDGTWKELFINVILWRGYAEEGGIWDPLLSLLPTEDLNDEYYYYIGQLKKTAASDDEDARKIFSYLEDKIIPAVSVGVVY